MGVLLSDAMLSTKGLMLILNRGFLLKALLWVLLYSLVPVGEIALLLYLKPFLGNYLLIALVLFTGLVGAGIAWKLISSALRNVNDRVKSGAYPREEFAVLAGAIIAGLFLVTPGFVTDVLGLMFALPGLKRASGSVIAAKLEPRLKELYEYMKL